MSSYSGSEEIVAWFDAPASETVQQWERPNKHHMRHDQHNKPRARSAEREQAQGWQGCKASLIKNLREKGSSAPKPLTQPTPTEL